MATQLSVSAEPYKGGSASAQRGYVGYYGSQNWVMRYSFKTPSAGYVTNILFRSYWYQYGSFSTYPVRAYVTTSASSHLNAGNGSAYQASMTAESSGNYNVKVAISGLMLEPSTTYYLYLFPGFTSTYRHLAHNDSTGQTNYLEVTVAAGSDFTVSNGTLGTAQTISITKKVSSYTDTLTYKCGSASGTILNQSTSTSVSWTPPLSLASQNTTGTSVSVEFTLTTYNGSTKVGSTTKTVVMSIPASVVPSVSMVISDALGYATKYGWYVQNQSKLKVVLTTTTAYGSAISAQTVTADGVTYSGASVTTEIIKNSGSLTVTAKVTDQRGRSATVSQTITVQAYSQPAITSINYNRANSDGTDNPLGDYAEVIMSAAVTSLNDINTATYMLRYKKTSESVFTYFDMDEYTNAYNLSDVTALFAADAGSSYNVIFTVSDAFSTAKTEFILQTGAVLMHRRKKGIGMGIGMMCEEDYTLAIAWDTIIHEDLTVNGGASIAGTVTAGSLTVNGKTLLERTYPVGAVYISTVSTSPASLFGGTWERITDRFLLAGQSSTYPINSTGGAATVTLSVSQIPSHNHVQRLDRNSTAYSYISDAGTSGTSASGAYIPASYTSAGTNRTLTTQGTGGGGSHNNMPPYLSVYMWKRTA